MASSKLSRIHAAWNEYSSFITRKDTSLRDIDINGLISSFFCPGPFYYYIIDFSTLSYIYIHPNIKEVFGVAPESFSIEALIGRAHPDDIAHAANGEKMAFDFMMNHIPVEKRKKYKIAYCVRLKAANGSYKLFQQQALTLTLDEEGRLGKVLGFHTDISHITTTNNYKVSFIGLDGEPSYLDLDPLKMVNGVEPIRAPFSKREVEIIKLLAEGFIAKSIAEKLFISVETVKTHQKNILSKSGCKSTLELVSKCIREGLI